MVDGSYFLRRIRCNDGLTAIHGKMVDDSKQIVFYSISTSVC